MSWPDVTLVAVCIAGAVTALRFVLPYVRTRTVEQRQQQALDELSQRLNAVESSVMEQPGRLPVTLRRRA